MSVAVMGMLTAMTPSAPLGAAAASMASNESTVASAAEHGAAKTSAAAGMPMAMTPSAPSGAASGSMANGSSVPSAAEHAADGAIDPTRAPKATMHTSPVAAASVASPTPTPAPTSAGAQKGHLEVPSQQHDRKHLTLSGNHPDKFVIPNDLIPWRKQDVTEEFCKKWFHFAPCLILCKGGKVTFRTDNVEHLPMNKETIHEFQQTLLALHRQIQRAGSQFYDKKIVESFHFSGLVKAGGFHSPQTFAEVLDILRSAIVAAKAKHNVGWLVVFIAEYFWSVIDDIGTEKGLGDTLRQLVGPKFTFEDIVWGNNGKEIKHRLIRIANKAREGVTERMHSLERKYGYALHRDVRPGHSKFESNVYKGFGPGCSYTIKLRLQDISQNPRVVFQCQRSSISVSKKILPPSMANNKPSPEDLSRWLWKDTLESRTTTLVQDALTNNITERHVTHLLSTKYTQMLWMTGCPISAHAPQRPKGNQMSAISNHNTGANKVSPINERTHGRGNDATPNNDQTLAKVCSP